MTTDRGQGPEAAIRPGEPDDELELRRQARRQQLKLKQAEGVVRLMSRRDDLRGINKMADLVADSVNWSA